jgi:SPP1 gp7 family putative phage head morphogenesis protein
MPVITKAQRKRAALRSIARLERDITPGIRRVSRAWRRLRGGLAAAVLSGEPILGRVQTAFQAQTATLAGAMRLAYLRGAQHVLTAARPHMPAQLALYDRAVASMEARLGMDAAGRAALAKQIGEKAARVLTLTGTALETRLHDALIDIGRRELLLGAAKKEMRRVIADTGLGPEKTYQLEAIFRTQTQIAYNAGRWDALQDEAIQDVLWGYEYATVGDDRVRDSHAELDGTRAPKDDPIWTTIWPPNGWNCRCTTIELFEPEPTKAAPVGWQPDTGFVFDPRNVIELPT